MKQLTRFLFFLSTISVLAFCQNVEFDEFRHVKKDDLTLREFLTKIKTDYQLPSIACASISNGKVSQCLVLGKNKVGEGKLLSSKSQYHIGSCSKAFTALLIAHLVHEGVFEWESKLIDIARSLDGRIHEDYGDVSIKHLLSHTAGVRPFVSDDDFFGMDKLFASFHGNLVDRRRQFVVHILNQPESVSTGEFEYSNAGYVILAFLAEEKTGIPFERLMDEKVFVPLELHSAQFGFALDGDDSHPQRHFGRNMFGVANPIGLDERVVDPIFNPAGNISMTMSDFGIFLVDQLKGIRGLKALISSNYYSDMHQPHVRRLTGDHYGFGWIIRKVNGIAVSHHFGSEQTFFSAMSLVPSTSSGIAVSTNIGDSRAELALINVILEVLH